MIDGFRFRIWPEEFTKAAENSIGESSWTGLVGLGSEFCEAVEQDTSRQRGSRRAMFCCFDVPVLLGLCGVSEELESCSLQKCHIDAQTKKLELNIMDLA